MNSNQSDSNTLPSYKLYFDDVEEIFLNTISVKYLLISSIVIFLLTLASIIILIYRSRKLFLGSLIPFIYSLLFYDFIQLLSIVLLKYNLSSVNKKYFGEICRWPYYLKASSEAGQCITLIFIYGIRCQKVRYFLKHKQLPNSSYIHSRALTFVCVLFIIYVNNWITHLKVEKIHLVTLNESNYGLNIQEYPITFYGINDVKLNDHGHFYSDLDRYAQNYENTQLGQSQSGTIIQNQKHDSAHEILIKIPYNNFFAQNKPSILNRTRRTFEDHSDISNKTFYGNNSYRINRCTYGQNNYFLASFLSLIHSIFYFIILCYYLTTIYRYKIPHISTAYCQKLHHDVLQIGRRRYIDHHKQLILLTHLRHFQYLIAYCHTTFTIIRLIYICSFTLISCITQTPFQWLTMKLFYYSLFIIVYYSIPLRVTLLFLYLFLSLFSSHIHSIFHYIFYTKLHFSCQLQKPTIRFHLRFVQYHQRNIKCVKQSKDSLVLDLTSSGCDEPLSIFPNDTIATYDENSSSQNPARTSSCAITIESEHGKV
ncbi:unnamed protein product [Rotaria magnacalcarata]|uniref:Uncharacterized protein n=1 Tax=Rotaria magnacalcarata TaxID=392030 RepID=A0A815IUP7_9BILA|nr:unnamed protein product [Rotaria magnacalcarata]CAF1370678.1 unnamed protein product [Rotaria magnacalcarata]CAF2115800.1 unnamed protein product [Rotaria magnacalcarata]CAF2163074.1 unnamed protein product [Rotaria magnacalcarata]CAF2167189.1 unnamed protein product [Rotaria magnacalcarata]